MKRYLLLALTTVPVVIAFGSGCKKTVPTVEAGTDIPVAAVDDAAVAAVDLDAGPATPLATVAPTPTVAKTAAPVAGGPFQGTYSCFNGTSITQTNSTVTARQQAGKTDNYASTTCTATGDMCDGTTTIYVGGKVSGTKHATLKRNPGSGDITYKGDGEASTICHKK